MAVDTLRIVAHASADLPRLPRPWTELLLDAVGERVRLAPPVVIPVYGDVGKAGTADAGSTRPALSNEVRVRLRRDGHVDGVELTARSLSDAADQALLRAVREADSAATLPALPDGVRAPTTVFLSLAIQEPLDTLDFPHALPVERISREVAVLSLPVFRDATRARPLPGNRGPRYPERERNAGREGEVLLDVVLDERGTIVPGTLRLVRYTSAPFVRAVYSALEQMRFAPATIAGCPVKQLVRAPFQFELRR